MPLLLRKITFGALCLSALVPAAPAAEPLSFNAAVTSDYRYRGVSQTRSAPAFQGGVDYAHASGFYLGAWGSTIRWIRDAGGEGRVELDLYGGYKTELRPGLTLDLGLLQYAYPRNQLRPSANTLEAYGALAAGPATLKLSRSQGNLFGFADSAGSLYADLSASFDLGGGFSLTPHIGRQTVRRNAAFSYTDYALALSKDWAGATWSLAWVDTNTAAYQGPQGKDLGKATAQLTVKATF